VSAPEPEIIDRPAARVLLIDPDDRILLVRFFAPNPDRHWWIAPGGGVDPGETPEQAARRELAEETGLAGVELSPCVWVREHVFDWAGSRYRQMERYYMARTQPFELAPALLDHELDQLTEYRWWSLAELEAAGDEVFAPRRLPDLLRSLLSQGPPAEPINAGV
jgi:8-oxo-dGTP pyrophosphatase MutT (NUDIX family)